MNLLPFYFLLLHFVSVSVYSSAIIIKSGIVKNQGQQQNENLEDVKFQKGTTNFDEEDRFHKDNQKKFVLAEDKGRYGDQSSNKKSHLDANNINEENFHQNVGEHLGNVDSKVAHHKGHHKSGFQNSYHKDESGSNSSYFDDGSDLADEQVHKNYRGSYGDADQRRQNVGRYDSSNFANDQARQGVYDNAGRYENDEGNRRNYNRRNYYNDREDLSRKNLGNNYNSGGHYAEEKYLERPYPIEPLPYRHETDLPHYHDESYRRPLVSHHPREHITVYEDPRYVHSDPRYRRSDDYIDDYIELDVRSPLEGDPYIRRYEEQRPLYYYD